VFLLNLWQWNKAPLQRRMGGANGTQLNDLHRKHLGGERIHHVDDNSGNLVDR
jgi:hypothetical protein